MGTDGGTPVEELSLNEWVVLAVLAEGPTHGFAIARGLRAGGDLGRILTVHRPLVYRALDRIAEAGFAEPQQTEPGDGGPTRTVFGVTPAGSAAVEAWLDRPVEHIRDLRIEFVAKVRLNDRRNRTAGRLIAAQQAALADAFRSLTGDDGTADVVDLWRRHTAAAAQEFLADLASRAASGDAPAR